METILKEANPNYKDPETFFERMAENTASTSNTKAAANTKEPKKDSKKSAKK